MRRPHSIPRRTDDRRQDAPENVRVLNLVTNAEARFFKKQLEALGRRKVRGEVLSVPHYNRSTHEGSTSRSVLDYVLFYPMVLGTSLDGYDLVHANYGLTAPAALAQPTRPVVVSLWGSDLMGTFGPLCSRCVKRADAVIVMTDEMAAALEGDCHVIPHGVDLELFEPAPRTDARAALGWDEDAKHVLFPYPIQRAVKNYPRAERVFEAARERVAGDLELHAIYGVPHEEMPTYMNAADVLLLTSRREGSPNSVKEALACNLPVVSTDVGDVSERLAGVHPSHVCQSDEELVEGLVDVLRRDSRSDGRAAVEEVSLERMGDRIRDVYDSVL